MRTVCGDAGRDEVGQVCRLCYLRYVSVVIVARKSLAERWIDRNEMWSWKRRLDVENGDMTWDEAVLMQGSVAQPTDGPWGLQHIDLACATVARCGNMTCAGMNDGTYLVAQENWCLVLVVMMVTVMLMK